MNEGIRLGLGILMIVVGGLYPLAASYRLNKRLGRPDGPGPRALVGWLAFTLSFPFALALTGVAFLIPRLAGSPAFRLIVGSLWGFALVAGVGYLILKRRPA